jgi:hypothetical protein
MSKLDHGSFSGLSKSTFSWCRLHWAILLTLSMVVYNCGLAVAANGEKRVALVVGNGSYSSVPLLPNPTNDARDIAQKLKDFDFEVLLVLDASLDDLRQATQKFSRLLSSADVGMLYYAGHGMQVDGINYLIPTDARLEVAEDLKFEAVSLDFILDLFEDPSRISVLLIDACRDNPFAKRLQKSTARSLGSKNTALGRGLAEITSGMGTYIGFSTEPGNVAIDGDGRNSPFAAALLNHIGKEEGDIETLMRLVRQQVYEVTEGKQLPWGNSSLMGKGFRFSKATQEQATEQPAPKTAIDDELEYWTEVQLSKDISQLDTYIERYPNGRFVAVAKLMRDALSEEITDDSVKSINTTENQNLSDKESSPGAQTAESDSNITMNSGTVIDSTPEQPKINSEEGSKTLNTELKVAVLPPTDKPEQSSQLEKQANGDNSSGSIAENITLELMRLGCLSKADETLNQTRFSDALRKAISLAVPPSTTSRPDEELFFVLKGLPDDACNAKKPTKKIKKALPAKKQPTVKTQIKPSISKKQNRPKVAPVVKAPEEQTSKRKSTAPIVLP